MPRGQPDFGMYATKTVGASLADIGELGVRLGAIDIYDKRGDVVDFDNFEGLVLKWKTSLVAPATIRLVNDSVKSGSQAVHLVSRAVALDTVYIYRTISVLGSKRLGIEWSFSTLSLTTDLYIVIAYDDGTTLFHEGIVKIDPNAQKIYIENPAGGYDEIASFLPLVSLAYCFYTCKLVVDFATDKYVRLLFADTEYDVSGYTLFTGATAATPYIDCGIEIINRPAVVAAVWVDDFILTQSEP